MSCDILYGCDVKPCPICGARPEGLHVGDGLVAVSCSAYKDTIHSVFVAGDTLTETVEKWNAWGATREPW